jgi:hypothetical protein
MSGPFGHLILQQRLSCAATARTMVKMGHIGNRPVARDKTFVKLENAIQCILFHVYNRNDFCYIIVQLRLNLGRSFTYRHISIPIKVNIVS